MNVSNVALQILSPEDLIPAEPQDTTLPIILLREGQVPQFEQGVQIKYQGEVVLLERLEDVQEDLTPPGKSLDVLRLSFVEEGVAYSFNVNLMEKGVLIKPLEHDAEELLKNDRNRVISNAISLLNKQKKMSPNQVSRIYLKFRD